MIRTRIFFLFDDEVQHMIRQRLQVLIYVIASQLVVGAIRFGEIDGTPNEQ